MNFLKNNIKKMLITTILLFFLVITISSANAVDLTLNPGDIGGINSAVSAVTNDSDVDNTITLNPGTYNKPTDRNNNITFNNKNLLIQGNGSTGSVIIDAQKFGRLFNITGNSNLTFINITFINGNSELGGAIYNTGGIITIINCTFIKNTATDSGGAIFNFNGDNLYINSSTFTNNSADYSGGAIYNNGYDYGFTVNNSTFIGNNAIFGGAIFNLGDGSIITNSSFINNRAIDGSGGAVYNVGTNLAISNSNFTNNSAIDGSGGAILNSDDSDNVSVNNCIFDRNKATYGGAISNRYTANFSLSNSIFTSNNASFGGAIYNNGFNLNLNNSTFTNNNAREGGAVQNSFAEDFSVNNSTFTNNNATNGGAIYNNEGTANVSNSIFTNNSANDKGSVLFQNLGIANISYSVFSSSPKIVLYSNSLDRIIADNNFWGSNNISKMYYGFKVNNYYVAKLSTNVKNGTLSIGDKLPFTYNLVLNGTSNNSNAYKLPYFIISIKYNDRTIANWDGRYMKTSYLTINSETSTISAVFDNTTLDNLIYTTKTKNSDNKNKTRNNPNATSAAMKETGIPINLVLMALLIVLGILIRKKY